MTDETKNLTPEVVDATPAVASTHFEAITPLTILDNAVRSGVDPDQLEKLLELVERYERGAAQKSFNKAFAVMSAGLGPIAKNKTAQIHSKRTGSTFEYSYTTSDELDRALRPVLSPHGFSLRYDLTVTDNVATAVVYLMHCDGHSESAEFPAPIEQTEITSRMQNVAKANTFARRQATMMVLGLSSADDDDDGAGLGSDPTPIDEKQASRLIDMIEAIDGQQKGFRQRYLAWLGVDEIEQLPAARYQKAFMGLERKLKETE